MTGFAGHEVKCAECNGYFRLDQVRQEGNGYYCRKCLQSRKRKERARSGGETVCPVCGKVLTSYDLTISDGGRSYCATCYYRHTARDPERAEAPGEAAEDAAGCSKCGKKFAPGETRVVYAGSSFCIACYDRSAPYLDIKPAVAQIGDAMAAMRSDKKVVCAQCRRDLGPLDVRVREGVTTYCEKCYKDARDAPENRRFFLAEQAGINTRPGATSLRDASNLVECANCGWIITRDRLEKDARGRLRCPRCGKKSVTPPEGAPEKAKLEKKNREKPGTEDFAVTAQLFKCLGDPCRVKIIESLSEKELCVFQFVDLTGFQYSAISYHLKLLKEMGLIQSCERGNFMVYSLTDKGAMVHEFIGKSRTPI